MKVALAKKSKAGLVDSIGILRVREWIGKSGEYKGKVFDLLGVPPGKAQFHGPTMQCFLPSVDAHFLKQIDYVVLDTRFMTAAQKQVIMDYINSKWSSQIARLIVL